MYLETLSHVPRQKANQDVPCVSVSVPSSSLPSSSLLLCFLFVLCLFHVRDDNSDYRVLGSYRQHSFVFVGHQVSSHVLAQDGLSTRTRCACLCVSTSFMERRSFVLCLVRSQIRLAAVAGYTGVVQSRHLCTRSPVGYNLHQSWWPSPRHASVVKPPLLHHPGIPPHI